MCLMYICYYRFMVDYPMFVYSGSRIRNHCVKWRRWLDSVDAKALSITDYTSSSFWKGALPPYRERYDAQSESHINLFIHWSRMESYSINVQLANEVMDKESEAVLPIQLHIRIGQPRRTSRVLRAISTPVALTIAEDGFYEVLTAKIRTKLPTEGFEWPTQGPNSRLFLQPTANTSPKNFDELQEDEFYDQLLEARLRSRYTRSDLNIFVWIIKNEPNTGRQIQRSSEARRIQASQQIAAMQLAQQENPPLGNLAYRHLVDRISRISNPAPDDFTTDTNTFRQARHLDVEADRLRNGREAEFFQLTILIGDVDIPIRINRIELLRGLNLPDMNLMGLASDAGGVATPDEDMEDADHQEDENETIET